MKRLTKDEILQANNGVGLALYHIDYLRSILGRGAELTQAAMEKLKVLRTRCDEVLDDE